MDGPVPLGRSAGDQDAMMAGHAACGDEPPWLDDGAPPDPEEDDREWPGGLAEVVAQSEADEAEQAEIRWRLLAAGMETGSAHVPDGPVIPGVQSGPGGGFGQGQPWDVAAPDVPLAVRADYASGVTRDFAAVSDDELSGVLGARRRLEARQAWERLAVVAEIIRRRPAPGCQLRGPAAMPQVWAEGTAGELSPGLAVDRRTADHLLGLAWDLQVKLPLTAARLREGIIDERKTATIAAYCANLTPEEARRAEQILFARPDAAMMTHGMVRDRIARAVIEVNPDTARKRREDAAKECRVEVRAEESGNAMIAGRELPSVAVLKMDQLITARARLLKKAGVDGDMDTLRVLAFLERFGEADPLGDLGNGGGGPGGPGGPGPGGNGGGTPCRRPILSGGCEIRTREGSRHAFQFCCWPFVGSQAYVTRHDGTERTVSDAAERPRMRREKVSEARSQLTYMTPAALIMEFVLGTGLSVGLDVLHDDDDLSVLHHVVAIALIQDVGAQALLHVMVHLNIGRIIQIAGIEQLLNFENALFR